MNFFEGQVAGGPAPVFEVAGEKVPLGGYAFAGPYAGPAWLGIRPEHVRTGGAAQACAYRAQVPVDLVEPMGSDTLVWTTLAGQPFRVRVEGQTTLRPGDPLPIGFDLDQASLFDTQTEHRL